jgi:hypothetical protein
VSWAEKYMIVGVRGRIYTRAMVRAAALKRLRDHLWPILRHPTIVDFVRRHQQEAKCIAKIDQLLDDPAWMRKRRGEVPVAVTKALCLAATGWNCP